MTTLPPPGAKAAHPATEQWQRGFAARLQLEGPDDRQDATQGFMGSIPDATIRGESGHVVWSMAPYAFIEGEAPPTVNASLWRQARLNGIHGLFKVCERIYQVRGFDIANVTFIEGDSGLIVIDPLTFEESARAALQLYERHRGHRPVRAVFYTHSHRDHYGGARGIVNEDDVKAGRIEVIAPHGFMEEAMSEALLAGIPMLRRAQYQFGTHLPAGAQAHVDSGLGKAQGKGTSGLIAPTRTIRSTGERLTIDGLEIEFQLTPGAEAPVEMNLYFPALRALDMAENACHTMHNLCPLRGAKVRDALAWARYLDESVELFGQRTDVCLAQHHWPTWGGARIAAFLTEQRDLYRFLHDQTLRLMSHGLTPREIAEQLMLPASLARRPHARGYYGALVHNVQAIYAFYMGPYDGNPANLDALPPVELARKHIEYAGGMEAALERAQQDFERGEFRWVAQIANHAVFADPGNARARALCADAFEQLGYQSENATWRNAYLFAAKELREGVYRPAFNGNAISPAVVARLPMPQFFDFLAMRVIASRVADLTLRLDWVMEDEDSCHRLTLSHCALTHQGGSHGAQAQATVHTTRQELLAVLRGPPDFGAAIRQQRLRVSGDVPLALRLFGSLDSFDPQFCIAEP